MIFVSERIHFGDNFSYHFADDDLSSTKKCHVKLGLEHGGKFENILKFVIIFGQNKLWADLGPNLKFRVFSEMEKKKRTELGLILILRYF